MENKYSMTFPQKNIWLVETFYNNKKMNIISGSLKINQDFNINLAEKTINKFIELNDAMRFTVKVIDSKPVNILNKYEYEKIDVIAENDEKKIKEIKAEMLEKSIDIFSNKLYSYLLIDKGNGKGEIVLKVHHIICDAWSVSKMGEGLSNIYEKYLAGDEEFTDYPSYIDFMQKEEEYLNSEKKDKDKEFWKEYLKEYTEAVGLKEFTDNISYTAKRYSAKLDKDLEAKLNKFCTDNKCSPYTVFMVALAIYMERVTEKTDIVIGTPVLNRSNFVEKNMQGMFVSTMPVRFKIDEQDTFLDMCKKQALESMSLFRHQKYPYSMISEDVKEQNGLKDKLYRIMLSYQNARTVFENKEKYEITWDFSGEIQDELEIHVSDLNNDGSLNIFYDYLVDVFEPIEIEYLSKRIEEIIRDGIENNKTVETINIMPEEEKNKILYEFNNTKKDYPKDKTVVDLFEEQVEKTPNNVALVFEGKEMTYKELNDKANSLAWYLKEQGVKENDIISIIYDRSFEIIISILGVLKANATYLPIDPKLPIDRIKLMIQDSKTIINIVQNEFKNLLQDRKTITIDEILSLECKKCFETDRSEEAIAYILYTSGTTGIPKGTMVTYNNLLNFTYNFIFNHFFEDFNNILSLTTISFDIFVFEAIIPLFFGKKVVIANESEQLIPAKLLSLINKYNIDVMQLTPSRMNLIFDNITDLSILVQLKKIVLAGEKLTLNLKNKISSLGIKVYNGYGPTETTIFSSFTDVTNEKKISIGKPFLNTGFYIRDRKNRLLPLFVKGELFISGLGLFKGYLNNSELTNNKVINVDNIIQYASGDLCSIDNNLSCFCYGRNDNQIKIHGQRIEIEDIELNIKNIAGVGQSAVILKNINNKDILVAFITLKNGIKIKEQEIKDKLLVKIPNYMVPTHIICLEKLPYTPNQKIDKKCLQNMKIETISKKRKNVYSTLENKIIDIIEKNISIVVNSLEDSLINLGADSFDIIKVTIKINEAFKIDVKPVELMNSTSIYDIFQIVQLYINKEKNNNIKYNNISRYPLSENQMGIFNNYIMNTESLLYNITFSIIFDKNLDLRKLKDAIVNAVYSNEIFFATFEIDNTGIYQKIDFNKTFVVDTIEKAYIAKPFDLLQDILIRVSILKNDNEIQVFFDIHHIIFDRTSIILLINTIKHFYENQIEHINSNNSYFTKILKDIEIKKQQDYIKSKKFYCDMFEGFEGNEEIATDNTRPSIRTYNGEKTKLKLNEDTYNLILKYAKKNGVTINSILFSAYTIIVSKFSYSEDICTGIISDSRDTVEELTSMGMYADTIPIRTKIDWKQNIIDYIKQNQKNMFLAMENRRYSYQNLVRDLNLSKDTSRNPLFDTLFIYQNSKSPKICVDNKKIKVSEIYNNVSKFDISFEVIPVQNTMNISIEFNNDIYNKNTIHNVFKNYCYLLNKICTNSIDKLNEIEIVTEIDKLKILNKFNDTEREYPKDKSFGQIFEQIVSANNNSIALKDKNQTMTYGKLNERANQIARFLRAKGVKRNEAVVLVVDKSFEMLAGILGIIKSGACYVPIDEHIPLERIKYIIKDCNAKILLKKKNNIINIKDILIFNLEDEEINVQDKYNVQNINKQSDLAYIIYTSGSTGNPKGAMNTHRGMIKLGYNINYVDFAKVQNILLSSNLVFDASVYELCLTMLNGKIGVLVSKDDLLTPVEYKKIIIENPNNLIVFTTQLFHQYAELMPDVFANTKYIIVGGDVLLYKYVEYVKNVCNSVKIINIYGPAECSAATTTQLVNKKFISIPIGKPISNTHCYIMDKCDNICDLLMPGELYIGGDGVGKGYINNEKLTKQVFKNYNNYNIGKIYKSGDIVKWLPDGTIAFCGRKDNQIKIRGYRIEVYEIENSILEYENINEVKVLLLNKDNKKELIAYYTSNKNIDIEDLKKYLKEKLPFYMVPSYFVYLKNMPLNASGKIDKKELLNYKFKIETNGTNITLPQNELQEILLDIIKDTMKLKNVGIDDNLIDLGLDSIAVVNLCTLAESKGINISYSSVFKYPTIRGISKNINFSKENNDSEITNYNYNNINYLLKNTVKNDIKQNKNIIIFGANGFLGVHLLKNCINNSKFKKIICVVRNKNGISGEERLKNVLKCYFNKDYSELFNDRIIVINKSIIDNDFDDIINDSIIKYSIDMIINALARTKNYGIKEDYYLSNIFYVEKLINICLKNNIKLCHISTLNIFNSIKQNEISMTASENDLYVGQNLITTYDYTKFIAERKILESAVNDKLNCNIIRLPKLINNNSGISNLNTEDDLLNDLLNFVIRNKCISKEIVDNDFLYVLNVDTAAEGILNICDNDTYYIYHLLSNTGIISNILNNLLITSKLNIDILTDEDFIQRLYNEIQNTNNNEAKSLYMYISNINKMNIYNLKTTELLKHSGFKFINVSDEYIKLILKNIIKGEDR